MEPETPPAPADPPVDDSLEAALGAAIDRMDSGEAEPASDEAPVEQDTGGPLRDEHGRFAASKPGDPAGAADDRRGEGGVKPQDAPLDFPEHWSEARRAKLLGLPPEHRESMLGEWRDIEREISDRQRELAVQREGLAPMLGVLEPLRSQFAAQGVAPEVALQSFVGAMQQLRANPAQGLFDLAERVGRPLAGSASARELVQRLSQVLGVDPGASLGDPAASAGEDEWLDPRAAREVTALRGQLSAVQQHIAAQQQQQQQMAYETAQREAQAFAEIKAADGSLAHPHFAAVRSEMARIIRQTAIDGLAPDLAAAYEIAVWSKPEIRQKMLESERQADASRREAERKAAVAKAKAASAAPNGRSRPGGTAPAEDRTLDDALGAAIDNVLSQHAA